MLHFPLLVNFLKLGPLPFYFNLALHYISGKAVRLLAITCSYWHF